MRKLNSKGFTPLHILLVLVIVGIVGGTGWYVYSDKKAANKSAQNQQQSGAQNNSPTSEKKYLEIPEMGLKIELSEKIEDAYYAMNSGGWAYLSVYAFDSYANCKANSETGMAAVASGKVGDDNFGEPFTEAELEERGTKIGDKYYWIDLAQSDCSADTNGENGDPNFDAVRNSFTQAKIEKL